MLLQKKEKEKSIFLIIYMRYQETDFSDIKDKRTKVANMNYDFQIIPDHMVNFSKASSWVLESSARIREVWVYGKGDPKHVLYLSTSQVVVFLQVSSNIVPFGESTAPQPESQAAQMQSIP